ncbi:hypothetical protein B0H17DRAFT_1133521 [Mycena rosella]|uniref:Uncharacterized protein n=1 Tax=Mycena rosella TaxID=1033263 RepID=A0AAD7GJ86_MYCRO|nr:hypothetical protein B0H17DRAFT_1133521 [Mycena rosella]
MFSPVKLLASITTALALLVAGAAAQGPTLEAFIAPHCTGVHTNPASPSTACTTVPGAFRSILAVSPSLGSVQNLQLFENNNCAGPPRRTVTALSGLCVELQYLGLENGAGSFKVAS